MKTRLLLSLIIIPIFAFFIFSSWPWPFVCLTIAALSWALYEVYIMFEKKGLKPYKIAGLAYGLFTYAAVIINFNCGFIVTGWALFLIGLFTAVILSRNPDNFTRIGATYLPLLYISAMGLFAIHMRLMENGKYWIFLLFLLTLVYDGGAYFVGYSFGRHKLIPEISPGKSIEGCLGGVVINVIVAVIIKFTYLPQNILGQSTLTHLIILAVLLSVTGQLGDLGASVIKRFCGVKNSSNLLPEMGGVLDKIDSALFNAPILFLYIKYVSGWF